MKIKFYFFGKANEVTDQEKEYLRRIGFRAEVDLIALPQAGVKPASKARGLEAQNFLKKLPSKAFLLAFDEDGKRYDSIQFSKFLKQYLVDHGEIYVVMGGAHGLDSLILERAQAKVSLGALVWTRNLCRLMICEQLYRALEIDGGSNFHKGDKSR
jgi:23S rRNA (pseudouridine1915-N3)-methyltransferase